MSRRLTRSLLAASTAAALASLVLGATGAVPAGAVAPRRDACPAGQVMDKLVRAASTQGRVAPVCRPQAEKETAKELLAANRADLVRHQGTYPVTSQAYASAVSQAAAIPASSTYGGSTWRPLGNDALYADVAGYGPTSEGFHNLAGRIQGLAYDPTSTKRWYAAVANGGLYESLNAGGSWHSIGEGLPSQIIGSIAVAKGGVLVVGSGDPAFGGDSYAGLGGFYSTDHGSTWHRSGGIPNGTITFRVAVDPTNTAIVYQATGKGLWRSTDAGRSYRNVVLPTTCASLTSPTCFFANIVSDVVVRPKGGPGHAADPGGEVLAAVGWRAGRKANAVGKPQAPQDGIYSSSTGAPGTFAFVLPATSGFPSTDRAGRTALGVAGGGSQNHDYVYALVEDPMRFNDQTGIGDLPTEPLSGTPAGATLNPTVLNGLYGSKDFGKHWTLMADADQLDAPVNQSALGGTECALGYCAGVQSWYNEWVQPSPAANETAEDGTPLFLSFGLEEVWGGSAAIPTLPNTGKFGVFGRYFSGTTCLALGLPELMGFCPTTGTGRQGSTVHPDQHALMYVPRGLNADIVVGNDGGAFVQAQQTGNSVTPYDNDHWGNGHNHGMHTLLPYAAVMAKDGTVWAGLQDNGEMKITPEGKQIMTYGGDGFFSAVDPDNSRVAYEEYAGGDVSVTTDGGLSWSDIAPCYASAQFSTPFTMDPLNAKHLVVGGSDVEESTFGPDTTTAAFLGLTGTDKAATCGPGAPVFGSSTDWVPVYSLGTTNGYTNTASAVDTFGASSYVGFCGSCDIVTQGLPFHSGLATNVGGSKPPKELTSNGWHVAAAVGLPQRIINSVTVDPANARTVYVTMGGYGRRWIPPGSLGDEVSKVGTGHVFVSNDAGEHFRDISGNLPDLAANWAVLHDGDLLVANDLGVYAVPNVAKVTNKTARYGVVGVGLPKAPVVQMQITPRNRNELLAASYGRGAQLIRLKAGSVPGGSTSGVQPTRTATKPHRSLAATGASTWLAGLALLLLGAALVGRRRVARA